MVAADGVPQCLDEADEVLGDTLLGRLFPWPWLVVRLCEVRVGRHEELLDEIQGDVEVEDCRPLRSPQEVGAQLRWQEMGLTCAPGSGSPHAEGSLPAPRVPDHVEPTKSDMCSW